MIRQKELAEKWGLTKGAISQMVSKGMPLTSEAIATKWRLDNQQKAFRQSAEFYTNTEEPEVEGVTNDDLKSLDTLGRLLRLQRAELLAFSSLATNAKNKNAIGTRSAIHAYERVQKAVRQAEIDHQQEKAHNRETVSRAEVSEVFAKHLGRVRSLLDSLASSACARANPSDPQCAKEAIEDAVRQLLVTIQKAEMEAFQ